MEAKQKTFHSLPSVPALMAYFLCIPCAKTGRINCASYRTNLSALSKSSLPTNLFRDSSLFYSTTKLSASISGLYFILSLSPISLITLHGTPAAKLSGGMFLVTTLPAPITQLSPMVTPGQTVTEAPNQQLLPMCTGFA